MLHASGRLPCDCPLLPLPRLVQQEVHVRSVEIGSGCFLQDGVLSLDPSIAHSLIQPPVARVDVEIIQPGSIHLTTDTIMDVMPLAAKLEGRLGTGITRVIRGAVLLLTGRETDGRQLGEAGDSAGILAEQVAFGAAGAPGLDDWIIRVAVTLDAGCGMERRGPWAAHRVADRIAQTVQRHLGELRTRRPP